ncbi:MAG: zinc-ribbon domain-containing protein, partial [Phycisphaeraceae bacterium]|nr:zinc-ribbon domain-containing protein [Phycisphaeraceae bacterium]
MNIKCPGCGQTYRVDPQRIPAAGASVKCMKCDHLIQVSPGMSVVEPKRVIVCPDCAKQYRIAESKIPANLTATRCQACGGAIPLVGRVSENPVVGSTPDRILRQVPGAGTEQSLDAVKPSETPVSIPESAPIETRDAIVSHHNAGLLQQWWFLITGAVVLLLLLCITLWIAMNLLPDDPVSPARPAFDVAQESATGGPNRPRPDREIGSRDVVVTPVAGITLRAPVLLKAVQGSSYAAKLPPAVQMGMMTLATLSLGSIDLFVCHDEAGVLWPVLRVEKPMARFLAGQFGSDGPLANYFIQEDEFTYHLNEPVITGVLSQMLNARAAEGSTNIPSQDELSSVPLEQYAVVLGESQVWLAPDCVLSALEQSPDLFEQASWTAWMKSAVSNEDVLRIYAQIPGDIDTKWTSWVLENEFVRAHPEAGIELLVATMEAPVTAVLKSVSSLKQVAVAVACPTVDQRRVTWVQQFNDVVLAQEVSDQLKAGSVGAKLGGHPLMPLVMRIMNCPELRRTT